VKLADFQFSRFLLFLYHLRYILAEFFNFFKNRRVRLRTILVPYIFLNTVIEQRDQRSLSSLCSAKATCIYKKNNIQTKKCVWFKLQRAAGFLPFEAASAGGGSGCALMLRDMRGQHVFAFFSGESALLFDSVWPWPRKSGFGLGRANLGLVGAHAGWVRAGAL
jgi:hypothetical protein